MVDCYDWFGVECMWLVVMIGFGLGCMWLIVMIGFGLGCMWLVLMIFLIFAWDVVCMFGGCEGSGFRVGRWASCILTLWHGMVWHGMVWYCSVLYCNVM